MAITLSRLRMYSHRASSMARALFIERMNGKAKVPRLLTAGETGGADAPLHHALMAVDEFQLSQPEQVPRMVHPRGRALGRHLPVLPEEAGPL